MYKTRVALICCRSIGTMKRHCAKGQIQKQYEFIAIIYHITHDAQEIL